MKNEIWKDIEGYEGLYQVSSFGRVRSLDRSHRMKNGYVRSIKGRVLAQSIKNSGYYKVQLSKDGTQKTFMVHRLVAKAFIPNPDELETVNHKDENKLNNKASNLEWMNIKDNTNYGTHNYRVAVSQGHPIVQLTLDGDYVNTYHSIGEAGRQTEIDRTGINKVILGKAYYSHNYCWCYEWEYQKYFKEEL